MIASPDLLIVLDELVKAEQDAQPSRSVVRLQVEADLVHDRRPLARVVMLDHVVDTCGQLNSDKFKSTLVTFLLSICRHQKRGWVVVGVCVPLPDALWGVDDRLHYVVSNKEPVVIRDVIDGSLCA